ncbi:hypothetical protein MMC28_006089 [Mycoblastus sanguinarius]|nr:hypothetical protein [Mycoblastus sanguinarius]
MAPTPKPTGTEARRETETIQDRIRKQRQRQREINSQAAVRLRGFFAPAITEKVRGEEERAAARERQSGERAKKKKEDLDAEGEVERFQGALIEDMPYPSPYKSPLSLPALRAPSQAKRLYSSISASFEYDQHLRLHRSSKAEHKINVASTQVDRILARIEAACEDMLAFRDEMIAKGENNARVDAAITVAFDVAAARSDETHIRRLRDIFDARVRQEDERRDLIEIDDSVEDFPVCEDNDEDHWMDGTGLGDGAKDYLVLKEDNDAGEGIFKGVADSLGRKERPKDTKVGFCLHKWVQSDFSSPMQLQRPTVADFGEADFTMNKAAVSPSTGDESSVQAKDTVWRIPAKSITISSSKESYELKLESKPGEDTFHLVWDTFYCPWDKEASKFYVQMNGATATSDPRLQVTLGLVKDIDWSTEIPWIRFRLCDLYEKVLEVNLYAIADSVALLEKFQTVLKPGYVHE